MSDFKIVNSIQRHLRGQLSQYRVVTDAYHAALMEIGKMYPPMEQEAPAEIRIGDWQAVLLRGSMHKVRCRRCGLTGEVSFAAGCDHRRECPLCNKLPLDEWLRNGFADLLPKGDTQVTTFIPSGLSSVDDIPTVELSEDGEGVRELEQTDEIAELSGTPDIADPDTEDTMDAGDVYEEVAVSDVGDGDE